MNKPEAILTGPCHDGACQPSCTAESARPTQYDRAGGATFHIPAMDCAAEESEIRRALEPIAGIRGLSFQLGPRTLQIDATPAALDSALLAMRSIGFEPEPLVPAPAGAAEPGSSLVHAYGRLALALVLALASESLPLVFHATNATNIAGMSLAAAAIGLAGFGTFIKGWSALRSGRLNINALMSVAVTGAFLIGQWPEAAMVMALYALAELIEARSLDRARHAIRNLMALAPDEADVRQPDGSWKTVLATEVPIQSIVRIRPGARVPLDGVITEGASAIDQSSVTGESIPVDKAVGDAVFAGTINQTAALEFRVTAAASDSTLARIIHAVEQAQGTRAPTQRFVDRFAAIYTPTVFALAIAVALLSPMLLGWTWLQGIYKSLVLLVIACPCALVISTPVTIVSALANAARRGILIKGGVYLEGARRLKALAFDKTGTLTEGKPKLVEFASLGGAHGKDMIAAIGTSLAGRSDHPVSKAIAAGLPAKCLPVIDFTALPGRGVSGVVDGTRYILGNHRFIEERGQCGTALEGQLRVHENMGRTVTVLASDHAVLGIFAVADRIRDSSRAAVSELKSLGLHLVMLTGDNAATARTIGTEAGIDDVKGNLLPDDKLNALKTLQRQYGPTGMAGDGINDAPALAQADIGFAMGAAGTDTAMEAADVVIMNDDLRRVASTVRLSRQANAVLWQNISLALGIKAVFLVWAVFGGATMWMAVFADMGASLLVIANGLRLLRQRDHG